MKKWLIGGWMAMMVACAPKPAVIPEVDAAMISKSGASIETLQNGRRVFVSQCGRCHELIAPDAVKNSDWKLVIPGMCWNAGISKADEAAVMAYVMAAKTR